MEKYLRPLLLMLIMCSGALLSQFVQPNSAELQIAMNRLPVLGSVLYIAAHPDDENTALLALLTKGRNLRTAYLSLTRGEGGQNIIGAELGASLGIIRTQELLAARRVDGAEQFFTRAIDFGYSKSSDEALRLWNKDSILNDVVWVIRTFRPDVIITRFSPTQGGHGHHLASAVLAEEAFRISGDSSVFPEQMVFVRPWKAKRLLFNHFRFGGANSNPSNVPTFTLDVGEYNPLLGRSYTEISGISRSMHRSQAMGSAQNKGSAVNEFVITAGDTALYEIFDDIDMTWNRVPGARKLARSAAEIKKRFSPNAPEKSLTALLRLRSEVKKLSGDPWIGIKLKEIDDLIQACAGLSLDLRSDAPEYTPGDSMKLRLNAVNRSQSSMIIDSAMLHPMGISVTPSLTLPFNRLLTIPVAARILLHQPFSQPYWLQQAPDQFRYRVDDNRLIGAPGSAQEFAARVFVRIDDVPVEFAVPVRYVWVDDIAGERSKECLIVPPVSIAIGEENIVWTASQSKQVHVRLHAYQPGITASVRLRSEKGWILTEPQQITMKERGEEAELLFTLMRDSLSTNGMIRAEAEVNGNVYRSTVTMISYEHIAPQMIITPAEVRTVTVDVSLSGRKIGYIMGAGDDGAEVLTQLGGDVTLLSDAALREGNFARFDAVVAGVRAYNTREQLRSAHPALMRYVENGGRYVVQYQVLEKGQTDNIGPYPIEISRNRVTDERAEVTFLKKEHPLLNTPAVLSSSDFDGWVQERGLYFPSKWDPRYETLLSMADPGEQPQSSALLAARYGKGSYVFTGLSLFRQLPAGVTGAYRLFTNLIAAGVQ